MSRIGADNPRYRARKRNNIVMLSVSDAPLLSVTLATML